MRSGLLRALPVVASVVACGPGSGGPPAERALLDGTAALARGYADGDAEAVAGLFAPDGSQVPPNGPRVVGPAALTAYWNEAFGWGRWSYDYDPERVEVSAALGVVWGTYRHGFRPNVMAPPGMGPVEETGSFVHVWRRLPVGWRLQVDITSRDRPLAGEGELQTEPTVPGLP